MNASALYAEAKATLAKAGVEDPAFDANVLFTHAFGKNRLLCNDAEEPDEAAVHAFSTLVAQRATRVPLQYLVGSWPFMGLALRVGPGVLVPRPETETLCRAAAALVRNIPAPTILDLCAGTGAVGLGVQTLLAKAYITCVEAFPGAFVWLVKNLQAFGNNNAHTTCVPAAVQADVFEYYKTLPPCSVDLIAANPPYVSAAEYGTLAPELFHEPREALAAGENGLLFYRFMAEHYRSCLKPGGYVAFEIGATQAGAVTSILQQSGYTDILCTKDDAGNDRVITAAAPSVPEGTAQEEHA